MIIPGPHGLVGLRPPVRTGPLYQHCPPDASPESQVHHRIVTVGLFVRSRSERRADGAAFSRYDHQAQLETRAQPLGGVVAASDSPRRHQGDETTPTWTRCVRVAHRFANA